MSTPTLHDMVSQALADAEQQTKIAEAGEVRTSFASPAPGLAHVASEEAEKVAAAVEEIVANLGHIVDNRSDGEKIAELLLLQEKIAADATNPGSGTGMNPAAGAATAMELNESGTSGDNPEVHDTARTADVPVNPGSEAPRPGTAATLGETNETSPPGGDEEWTNNAPLQKAASAQDVLNRLQYLTKSGSAVGEAAEAAAESGGFRKAVGKAADWIKKPIKEYGAVVADRTAKGKGFAEIGERYGAVDPKGMKMDALKKTLGENKAQAAAAAGTALATGTAAVVGAKKVFGKKKDDDGEKKAALNRDAVIELITKVASGGGLCKTAGCANSTGLPGTNCTVHEENDKVASLQAFFQQKLAGDLTSLDAVGSGEPTAAAAGGPDNYFASASGDGPAPPAPRGEKGVSSIDEAIALTKRDAKLIPKTELGEVIDEPAQSSASDSVIAKHLSTGGEAGVKISSVTEAAAVKAGLMKVAEEGCSCHQSGTCLYCCVKEATAHVACGCSDSGTCEACQLAASAA